MWVKLHVATKSCLPPLQRTALEFHFSTHSVPAPRHVPQCQLGGRARHLCSPKSPVANVQNKEAVFGVSAVPAGIRVPVTLSSHREKADVALVMGV